MKKLLIGTVVCAISMFGAATAGEKLTKEEVLALISDSNYSAKNPVRGTVTNGAVSADGSLSATSSDGTSQSGTWKVMDNGEYCTDWNGSWKSGCAPFEKTEDPNVFTRGLGNSTPANFSFKKK
ncbi:MAG: hypothetical protein H7Y60_07255 [Rhodospirillaceae bacterium]|nr:hypothetical protein [Rhodospirillales bacterium]